jgi:hypothetical protein
MSDDVANSKNYLILQELCEARDGKYSPPAGVLNQRLDFCIFDDNTPIIADEAVELFLSSFGFQNEDLTIQGDRTVGDLVCVLNDYWVNDLQGKSSEHLVFMPEYLSDNYKDCKGINRLAEYISGQSLTELASNIEGSYRFRVHIDQGFVADSQDNDDRDSWSYMLIPHMDAIISDSIGAVLNNLPNLVEQSTGWHSSNAASEAQLAARDQFYEASPGSIFGFSVQSNGKVLMYIPLRLNNELSQIDEYTSFGKSHNIDRARTALTEIYASGPAPFEIDFKGLSIDSGLSPVEIEAVANTLPTQWKNQFLATAFSQDLGL